jgi:hypothetical protein
MVIGSPIVQTKVICCINEMHRTHEIEATAIVGTPKYAMFVPPLPLFHSAAIAIILWPAAAASTATATAAVAVAKNYRRRPYSPAHRPTMATKEG